MNFNFFSLFYLSLITIVISIKGNISLKKYSNKVIYKNDIMIKKKIFFNCAKKLFYIKTKHRRNNYKIKTKNKNIIYNYSKIKMYENIYLSYLKNYIVDEEELTQKKEHKVDEEKCDNIKEIENLISTTIRKEEEDLFEFLTNVNEKYNLKSTLRVVGGWVRDKFLRISNDDIDITVDNMKGADFCNYIKEYIKEKENKNFNFGIIKINSDQSKHLETSSFNLFNFQVDIVNLRNEKYSEESRIPEIVIGTPEEDALRRDFTVNSLFYNLKNKKVEDYTKKGIFHLKNKIICTPLDPLSTFLDDPLRIIRCIRFCGSFDFCLEKSIFNVLKNEDIKNSFSKKISKSRLSSEITKIFSEKCKNIVLCLTLLNYSSYSSKIFKLPLEYFIKDQENFEKIKKKDKINKSIHNCEDNGTNKKIHDDFYETEKEKINKNDANNIIKNNTSDLNIQNNINDINQNNTKNIINKDINDEKKNEEASWLFYGLNYVKFFKEIEHNLTKEVFHDLQYKENVNYIYICLFLLPLKNHFYYIKNSKTEYVVEYIIRESLKLPLKYSKFCVNIFEGFIHLYHLYKNIDLLNFLKNNIDQKNNLHIKSDIVLFLKKVGERWNIIFFIFYIFHKYNEINKNYLAFTINDIYPSDFVKKLYQYILENNLQNSYKIKPFLKWPDIKNNFPRISSNQINEIYEQIIRFMCIHGENKKECIEFLKEHFKKYT
ncbi:tRNA nucleotidyltransferase, putative [Plasmodium gallinaceum]|uniref:tRNA nucleotidyltransferase, putative n=1 Tax=Plasmodium gallinaceum TaxID=5849 RepID=A0A1J1GUU5_PLAGA|nr:tRNA nucleotidyltransferase, putative [Plasmodium gallinaceum]CRG96253.1 tRNA nucleotidyltransferase, putative [Plasmodium gallinaceum]